VRAGINKGAMCALAAGHLGTDFANGALPALLPFLTDRFSLSYTLAAVLMLASTASSSLVQPLFGLWSDRRGALWLLPAGVAVAGVGIGLAAAMPSYWLVALLVVVSGLGVAAFHPEGSKFAAYTSGEKRASGMSAFSIGGNIGFALGPIAATPLVIAFGLGGGLLLAVPCLAIAALLVAVTPFLRTFVPERGARREAAGEDRPGALMLLLGVIGFRSLAWFGLITFVPLYEVSLGHSKAHGNHLLSLMLLAGGIGTIAAGPLADRVGRRPVLIGSLALAAPLTLVFITVAESSARSHCAASASA
jgi:FSR family fosmidomycin resistance protein-like MFS transporter